MSESLSESVSDPKRELAPSEVRAESASFAQLLGLTGAGVALLGVIIVLSNYQLGPRVLTTTWGFVFAVLGLPMLFYHALRDSAVEVRRSYLGLGGFLLICAIAAAAVPGPIFGESTVKAAGFNFLPWTPIFGMLSLLFLVTPMRHETDQTFQFYGQTLLLGIGATLSLGCVAFGIANPDTLAGPGLIVGLLGLGFLLAFLTRVDTSDGPGYLVASALGIVGAIAILYAFGRTVFPSVLYDGPQGLKNAFQVYDKWKLGGRLLVILACTAVGVWGALNRHFGVWLRGGFAIVGIGFAAVFAFAAVTIGLKSEMKPFLVPGGLILSALGALYLAISIAIVSESQFVTLTRRELLSIFCSPIAYLVLLGMAIVAWLGYFVFTQTLVDFASSNRAMTEPILPNYWGATMGAAFAVVFLVPVLTMRAFSEEKRLGTLEVLLTAPVNEATIVLSKFASTWLFFMVCWIPIGLFLIIVRMEFGSFDYRPMLSYYGAVAACGASFVAMGIFFSSLTKNQIIAAVLSFAAMFFMLLTIIGKQVPQVPAGLQVILGKFDYFSLWQQTLGGQLPLTTVLVHVSLAVFWVYLTIKVLEARKWN